ncbi:MAG: hypothetical protein HYV07_20955 [Deltaproteobacteria bacterium]|nr:hypothetical protein [Deltaproteobacteria bacterium]
MDGQEVIPLYAFVEGDTIVTLLLASTSTTMRELIAHAERSAGVRLGPGTRRWVVFGGVSIRPEVTVRKAGMGALDRFDVRSLS